MRHERGQGAAETMGVLLVVAAVVTALAHAGLGAAIASAAQGAVCRIAHGTCAGTPAGAPGPGGAPRGGAPGVAGPPLGPGGPLTGLPFPGSISVSGSCEAKPGGQSQCPKLPGGGGEEPGRTASVGVTATATRTTSRGNDVLAATGCRVTTIGLSTDLSVTGAGSVARGDLTLGGSGFFGHRVSYDATVTPGEADDIAAGRRSAPNPADPRTIPVGDGLVLSETTYRGSDQEASYHALQAQLHFERGRKLSSGVVRTDDRHVRIYVGDEDVVTNAVHLGLGVGDARIGGALSQSLSSGTLHQVDVDLTTPEGWAAYQAFATQGQLPAAGSSGTADTATTDVFSYENRAELEARLGPIGGTLGGATAQGKVTETHHQDGTTTYQIQDRHGDVTFVRDAAGRGEDLHDTGYTLLLRDVDGTSARNYRELQGLPRGDGGDLALRYSPQQLLDLQDQALDQLASRTGPRYGNFDHRLSRAEVQALLRRDPYGAGLDPGGPAGIDVIAVARADGNPAAVLAALDNAANGSPEALLEYLELFASHTNDARGQDIDARPVPVGDLSPAAPPGTNCRP